MEDATGGGGGDLLMVKELPGAEVVQLVGGVAGGFAVDLARVERVSGLEGARADAAVFAQDEQSLGRAVASGAGVILAGERMRGGGVDDPRVIWVRDARLAFARVGQALETEVVATAVHPTAVVGEGVAVGQRVVIGPGAVVEAGVRLGDDVRLGPRVVVHAGCELGARVRVGAGTVLGGRGFGFVRDGATGEYVGFPQKGGLVVEEDVAIGSNCTIDRGALETTRVGAGTKIDSLVHIAHSCVIGRRVVIAAQTGIAGSSVVGDDAVIAGQVGIADHVRIGEGVVLGAKCGVPSNKQLRGRGQVFWGIPARPIQQYLRELATLRRGLDRGTGRG